MPACLGEGQRQGCLKDELIEDTMITSYSVLAPLGWEFFHHLVIAFFHSSELQSERTGLILVNGEQLLWI